MWEGRLSGKGTKAESRRSLRVKLTEKATFKLHLYHGVRGRGRVETSSTLEIGRGNP